MQSRVSETMGLEKESAPEICIRMRNEAGQGTIFRAQTGLKDVRVVKFKNKIKNKSQSIKKKKMLEF